MQAITTPAPDPPITFTPVVDEDPRHRWWRHWPLAVAVAAGVVIGLSVRPSPTSLPPPQPDAASTMEWMFSAALAHEAVDEAGVVVAPALPDLRLESLEIVDATTGPMIAVVSGPAGDERTYVVKVERQALDWRVVAELVGD